MKDLGLPTTRLSSSKTIIYVGNFYFPNGSAAGTRVLGVGKALREAGYRVVFAGMEHRGRDEDRQYDGEYCYQGFSYIPEKDHGHGRLARLKRGLLTHVTGTTTMRRLQAMDLSTTQAIIAYHASGPLLWQLMSFCRKRGLALMADCTEWYDSRQVKGGRLGPLYWDSELRMHWLQSKIGRVIAVSSFLDRYYRDRGCDVIRIPPLIDMDQTNGESAKYVMRDDGMLRLVYAGSPGKKDLLITAIRGLRELRAAGAPVELHLVGLSRPAADVCVGKNVPMLDALGEAVVYHGRVPHPMAIALVAQADFSILVRPDERFAHAGFPTKLVESLSLGVPVITNLTSDIGEYVRDCKEGIVLEGCDPEAFAVGVRKALAMPREQWSAMRVHSRQRAVDCFDYRNYVAPLNDFVERAVGTATGKMSGSIPVGSRHDPFS
jgi:glycosyltransferase involved in cell wall biosynthesis